MKVKIHFPQIEVSYHPNHESLEHSQLSHSRDVYELCLSIWDQDTISLYEEVKAIYLNRENRVIGYRNIALGTATQAVVNIKLLVYVALACNASGVIVAHNHPSGNMKPSQQDIRLTQQIREATTYFNLQLLDHLIISPHKYFSFADDGMM